MPPVGGGQAYGGGVQAAGPVWTMATIAPIIATATPMTVNTIVRVVRANWITRWHNQPPASWVWRETAAPSPSDGPSLPGEAHPNNRPTFGYHHWSKERLSIPMGWELRGNRASSRMLPGRVTQ